MRRNYRYRNLFWHGIPSATAALAIGILFAAAMAASQAAEAQTYTVLHNFTGGADGANPFAGLTMDRAGNLYGTTAGGGNSGGCWDPINGNNSCGTVFKLSHHSSSWTFAALYAFTGDIVGDYDGANPEARVIIGPDGDLYGTTYMGGTGTCGASGGCGTVFKLNPPPSICSSTSCPWRETVVWSFAQSNGAWPQFADLVFDQHGNIYGTAPLGGRYGDGGFCGGLVTGCGVIFELSPSGGSWTDSVLWNFGEVVGSEILPFSGVTLDNAGNLYGTASYGGEGVFGGGFGAVYKLALPGALSDLYNFPGGSDAGYPIAGVIFDSSFSNLYGASSAGGAGNGGVVFKLSLSGAFTPLYTFTGTEQSGCPAPGLGEGFVPGPGPWASLTMDTSGNLYGTTMCDGANGAGNVFELLYSNGNYTYQDLYDFTGSSDGSYPISNVSLHYTNGVVDALYGTASAGGSQGYGVVWEITP